MRCSRWFGSAEGGQLALTPPLTTDHLIRVGAFPLWIAEPDYTDTGRLREAIANAVRDYSKDYARYSARHRERGAAGALLADEVRPRVILMPGLGALCAGKDTEAATIARDITAHTLAVKRQVATMGTYQSLPERELWAMETRSFQQAQAGRLGRAGTCGTRRPRDRRGRGDRVGHLRGVADTGLPCGGHRSAGEPLDSLVAALKRSFGCRAIGVPLDVTSSQSVSEAFAAVVRTWGGLDLVVVNAGLAHVARLAELDSRRVSTAGAGQRGRDAARSGRSGPTFCLSGERRRHRRGVDEERVRAGGGLRRLQRHESRVPPARADREPGDGRARRAGQYGRADAVFAHGRGGRVYGPRWGRIGCALEVSTNRDWKSITASGAC